MYEELASEAQIQGIDIVEIKFKGGHKGLYGDNIIAIDKKIDTDKEKTCILAEEIGHHYTTYGNILDQTSTSNRKQEKRARNYAYEKLITLNKIIEAYNNRVKNRYELAEFLNVTEDFLQYALDHYKNKYGVCYVKGDYTIYFEPLGVLRMFK
jgi:Zn-dependent peptidase ImmA (M78 family)